MGTSDGARRPKPEGQGQSKATLPKQFALNKFLGHELALCAMVERNRGLPWYIGDMTAGSGCDDYGRDGSPLIFARHLAHWMAKGHRPTLLCAEQDAERLDALRMRMAERYPDLPVEYFTSQRSLVKRIPWYACGLTYWDPTRYNNLDKALLAYVGRQHYYLDILITRECLSTKRMMNATHCPGTLTIQEYLALTGKKRNYIWQYTKYHWWTFGFADNYVRRDPKKMYGLVDVQSAQGRLIYRQWTPGVEPEADKGGQSQGELPWGA